MPAKTKVKPQASARASKTAPKRSAKAKPNVVVSNAKKTSKSVSFWKSMRGKLTVVLAFAVIGALSVVYVHAATTSYSLWSNSAVPQVITTGDTSAATLGTTFESQYAGSVTGVRFYKGAQNTGAHVGSLWTTAGKELASVTFTNETASGWQQANFATPVNISANTPYVVAYYAPHGHYSQTKGYFKSNYVNGPLTALAANNGRYVFTTNTAFPTKSRNGINYWVDVVVSASTFNPTPKPSAPSSLTGSVSSGTVTLQWQASPSTGVASYTVLRGGTSIGSVNASSSLVYHDTPSAGSTYSYQVEAVDGSGDVSSPSNSVSVTVPTPSTPTPPTPPTSNPAPVPTPLGSNIVNVSTSAQLTAALAAAQPGQTIELADGTYSGDFTATASGTATAPITIYGSSNAIIDGGNLGNGYAFYLNHANYWQVVGLTLTNAGKGLVADNSSHTVINGVTIHTIGDEGLHLREGSSYDVVEASTVFSTGQKSPGFGEGMYVGSAIKNWPLYTTTTDQYGNKVDGSNYDELLNNTIHNTGAENIDTKEGTLGGVLAGNTLSYPGSGTGSVDVKGNSYTVENNNVSNSPNNDHAAIEVWELVTGYGQNNVLSGNSLGSTGSALGIYVSNGTVATVVKCSNTVTAPTAGLSNTACTQ